MKKRYFYWALLSASLSQAEEINYTWRGGTSSAWSDEDNWYLNDMSSTGFGAPDLWVANYAECADGSFVTVDNTSLNSTINITSGTADIPQLFVDEGQAQDADNSRLQLDGLAFVEGAEAHVVNLGNNTTMENQILVNLSATSQTLNVAAGSEYDVVDMAYSDELFSTTATYNMTINNAGTFRVADPEGTHQGNTFTNTATSTNARGKLVLDSEETETTYTDNTIINAGGATWVGKSHNVSNNTFWNKVSSGIPGYTVFQGGGNAVSFGGVSSLQFDVNPIVNGFVVLKDSAVLTGTGSNLTLHLNTALDYTNVTRTLVYKNGASGGSITGEFTVTMKNQDGDVITTNIDYAMDYTTGTATATPVDVSKPGTINGDAIGGTLIPILRVTFSRVSTGITEPARRAVSVASRSANHTLEKVRTAVHKLFAVAIGKARQDASQTWGNIEANFGGSSIKGKLKENTFKAPSLTGSELSMTDGMFEMMGRENLERLSPLRTETTNLWIQPFGQLVSQAKRNNNASYETKTAGIVFGCDHKISRNLVVGGGVGTAHSTSEIADGTKGKITDRFATLFASWTEDDWYVDAVISGVVNKYGNSRKVNTLTRASSNHDGYQITPSLGLGYRLPTVGGWQIVPNLSATMIYTSEKGYTEKSAGANNQTIKGKCASRLRTELGADFARGFIHEFGKARYGFFIKGILSNPLKKGQINGSLGNNSFNIQPGDRSEIYLGTGGSAEFKFSNQWFVNVHYANELGAGLAAHEVALRVGRPL